MELHEQAEAVAEIVAVIVRGILRRRQFIALRVAVAAIVTRCAADGPARAWSPSCVSLTPQLKRESLQWPVQAEPRRVVTTSQIHGSRTDIRFRVSPPQPGSRVSMGHVLRVCWPALMLTISAISLTDSERAQNCNVAPSNAR